MKSPEGWALTGMWYDKFAGLPPRGSPLETVFLLVYLQRQEAQLLATRALVQSTLPEGKEASDPAIAAYQKYCDAMFPFMERAANRGKDDERKLLAEFVKHRARILLHPIYKAQAENAKRVAVLKRFRLQPKIPGTI
jgi:hypothetical protein